jgi:hypothetical protein
VGFAWIDLILKIPLVLAILIVWWVIRHEKPQPPASDDDGGIRRGVVACTRSGRSPGRPGAVRTAIRRRRPPAGCAR